MQRIGPPPPSSHRMRELSGTHAALMCSLQADKVEPLPALEQGESLPLQGVEMQPGKTSPPGHLTEVLHRPSSSQIHNT